MFTKVLEISPDNAEALVELGTVRYLGQRQIDEAFALYARAIRLSPQWYWCYLAYGDRLIDAGRFDLAANVLTDAIAHAAGQNSLVYQKLAQLFLENLDDPFRAIDICRQGLALYAQDANLYYWQGRAEARLGNHEAALSALKQATELSPDVIEFQNTLKQVK